MGPCEPAKQIYFCAFCNGPGTTRHHLFPGQGRHETIRLCRRCHNEVHWYFSNAELAMKFNSEERLRCELEKRKRELMESWEP